PRFCSQKCSGAFKTENKKGATKNFKGVCENCSKEFETYKSPSRDTPKFCSLKCIGEAQKGENNPAYNGGKYECNGYYAIFMPSHPNRSEKNIVLEHRFVMECKIGIYLTSDEVVHHIDFNKLNNEPDNLMLFPNQSEHIKFHIELKKGKNNG
ncbi:MAG: HNH endonuclease, partial [Sulfurimonas sp.]|nr:HNH endonuclease [Sulfurimonas sp.]